MERQFLPLSATDMSVAEGEPHRLRGYASTFMGPPPAIPIAPGAWTKTLQDLASRRGSLPLLFDHDSGQTIGRWVELRQDERGLFGEAELTPGHTLAREVYALLKHRAATGLSVGFEAIEAGTVDRQRVVTEAKLWEISVTSLPANVDAQVTFVQNMERTPRAVERLLIQHGYSRTEAKAFLARGWAAVQGAEADALQVDAAGVLAAIRQARALLRP